MQKLDKVLREINFRRRVAFRELKTLEFRPKLFRTVLKVFRLAFGPFCRQECEQFAKFTQFNWPVHFGSEPIEFFGRYGESIERSSIDLIAHNG